MGLQLLWVCSEARRLKRGTVYHGQSSRSSYEASRGSGKMQSSAFDWLFDNYSDPFPLIY